MKSKTIQLIILLILGVSSYGCVSYVKPPLPPTSENCTVLKQYTKLMSIWRNYYECKRN